MNSPLQRDLCRGLRAHPDVLELHHEPPMHISFFFFMAELYSIPCMYTGNIWASLVAQVVKNLPEMQETWFQSLGWEDLLEKGMATHSSILA